MKNNNKNDIDKNTKAESIEKVNSTSIRKKIIAGGITAVLIVAILVTVLVLVPMKNQSVMVPNGTITTVDGKLVFTDNTTKPQPTLSVTTQKTAEEKTKITEKTTERTHAPQPTAARKTTVKKTTEPTSKKKTTAKKTTTTTTQKKTHTTDKDGNFDFSNMQYTTKTYDDGSILVNVGGMIWEGEYLPTDSFVRLEKTNVRFPECPELPLYKLVGSISTYYFYSSEGIWEACG